MKLLRLARVLFLCVFVPISAGATRFLQNPVDSLQPGEWYEAPNSNLSAVAPSPAPTGSSGRLSSVINAWSGGAYDTTRDRLLVWGGGHADYGGNEIYAFDVNTLTWSRPWGPSMNPPPEPWSADPYPDGNPASRHSYDGMTYIPTIDRFWAQGGSVWQSGNATLATWMFDFVGSSWTRKKDAPDSFLGVSAVYDPVTHHVFHQGHTKFSEYDPVNDAWTVRGDITSIGGSLNETGRTAALDPMKRLFVAVGSGDLFVWDLNSWQVTRPATTGGSAIVNTQGPGFAYDSVGKKFVGWSGGTTVYTLDVTSWTWTAQSPTPTNTVTPTAPPGQGTYGRFRYIPSKNAFVVLNGVYENVFFYKLTSGAGSTLPPTPSTTPPPTGTGAPSGPKTEPAAARCGCGSIAPSDVFLWIWILSLAGFGGNLLRGSKDPLKELAAPESESPREG